MEHGFRHVSLARLGREKDIQSAAIAAA